MTDFTVSDWFERELWPTYPRDLCNRIGSKSKALLNVKGKVKNRDIANTIMASLREQMRYYRKVKAGGAHGAEWKMPMLSTWMSGERWTDEIGSHSELKLKLVSKDCKCGKKANILNLCWDCHNKAVGVEDWREKAIWAYFIKHNLGQQAGESHNEWMSRLQSRGRRDYRKIG